MSEMRRSDREVRELSEIYDILYRCDVVHMAMNAEGYPYVIPMTFGLAMEEGQIVVYIHCAGAGRKWELLKKDPRVCLEAALYYKTERTESGGITARFESVIGTGEAELVTDHKVKVMAIKHILDHYNESGFPVTSCTGLKAAEVFRIPLTEVSGKRNK